MYPSFKHGRIMYLKPYFYTRLSLYKFRKLFSSTNRKTISNLSKLANIIFEGVLIEKREFIM